MTSSTSNSRTARPEQAAPTVEAAEAKAEEAQQIVSALEERIRSGDASVSPDDLTQARQIAEFATLQRDAAHRRADEARRKAAEEAVQSVCDAARALAQEGTADIEKLRQAAAHAFAAYVDATDRHAFRVSLVRESLEVANQQADALGLELCAAHGVSVVYGTHLAAAGLEMRSSPARPAELLDDVVAGSGLELGRTYAVDFPIVSKRPWPPEA
jgi:hypothetical protein